MKISTVVLTQNNEKIIQRCIDSVAFADEIIVVDSFSTDKTLEICGRYNAKVFSKKFVSDVSSKNFGMAKAKNHWVFFIDSDEEVLPDLAESLKNFSPAANVAAYSVFRKTHYLGRWMRSPSLNHWLPRLLKKRSACWGKRIVHGQPEIRGKTFRLHGSMLHYSIETVGEQMKKIKEYTMLEARQKKIQHCNDSLLLFPFRVLADSVYIFCKGIFFELAFLDGWRGIFFAVASAYYYALADYKFFFKKIKH